MGFPEWCSWSRSLSGACSSRRDACRKCKCDCNVRRTHVERFDGPTRSCPSMQDLHACSRQPGLFVGARSGRTQSHEGGSGNAPLKERCERGGGGPTRGPTTVRLGRATPAATPTVWSCSIHALGRLRRPQQRPSGAIHALRSRSPKAAAQGTRSAASRGGAGSGGGNIASSGG